MLEPLGIAAHAELVYRTMLGNPDEGVAELAERLRCPVEQIREDLEQLSSLALVHHSAEERSGFRVVHPEMAMQLLLARQQAELAQHQLKVATTRAAAEVLIASCSTLTPTQAEPESERIEGADAIRDRLGQLGRSVEREVMTLAPGGAHNEADLRASRVPNAELLGRGVRVRTVYLHSVRNHQPTLDHVSWLSERGGRVRTATTLPLRAIIIDRRRAVIPVDLADARAGAIVTTTAATVIALCSLFEHIWESATPLGASPARDHRGLPAQEAEVLRMLADGHTDEAIARKIGVSPRTARRVAADLMSRLDARSRFEAGVRAVQEGWLPASR